MSNMKTLKIAGKTINLSIDPSLYHESFKDFEVPVIENPDLTVNVFDRRYTLKDLSNYIKEHKDNKLVSTQYMTVYKTEDGYCLVYPFETQVIYTMLNTRTWSAEIDVDTTQEFIKNQDFTLTDYVFFMIRDVFFCFGQCCNMLPVHSSSIIYNGKAYLFSAPSGTGKTTHTDFWRKLYGVEILDGDVTMLTVNEDEITASGMPWCGTSKRYKNTSVPLGNIILLSRAAENRIEEAGELEAVITITAESLAPNWNREVTAKTLSLAKAIASKRPMLHIYCIPEESAAVAMKNYIDKEQN